MSKPSVQFLCAHNAARSSRVEALLRRHASDRFDLMSAGLEPTKVHPLTIRAMNEVGVDRSGCRAKGLADLLGKTKFQLASIVCERTRKNCPRIYPCALERRFCPFKVPSETQGTEERQLQKFREARDQIADKIRSWLAASA